MRLLFKNVAFTLIVPGTVAVWAPLGLATEHAPGSGVRRFVALALLGLGAALYVWCVVDFATIGRGTPAPIDAPKRLVMRGPYRASRNPMYLAVLTAIAGWATLFANRGLWLYAAVVAAAFHVFVTGYEEPKLRDLFGAEYEGYCARVPRWLPRLSTRRAGAQ